MDTTHPVYAKWRNKLHYVLCTPFVTSLPVGLQSVAIRVPVRLSVCVIVCLFVYLSEFYQVGQPVIFSH